MKNQLFVMLLVSLWGASCNPNATSSSSVNQPMELSQNIKTQAIHLKTAREQRGATDKDLKKTEAFKSLQVQVSLLKTMNLKMLMTTHEKISFWVNVYNALVVLRAVELNVRESVREVEGFFTDPFVHIGGEKWSLDEIEHGVLRGNKSTTSFSGLSQRKMFYALASDEVDARIHFVLNCGAKSCPPLLFLDPKTLDSDLETATQNFIQNETKLKGKSIITSELLSWYASDFKPDVRTFLKRYTNKEIRVALDRDASLSFTPYDWGLGL